MPAVANMSRPVIQAIAKRASVSTCSSSSSFSTSTQSSSWAWRNLSARTRGYVVGGAVACVAADGVLVYEYYPGLLGLNKDRN